MEVRERVIDIATTCGNREWLMQEINLWTDWEIKTQLHPESIAYTRPPDSWKALINQRSRWASTGKNYSKLSIRLYLTLIYFVIVYSKLILIVYYLNLALNYLLIHNLL